MYTFYGESVPTRDQIVEESGKSLVRNVLALIGSVAFFAGVLLLNWFLTKPDTGAGVLPAFWFLPVCLAIGIATGHYVRKFGEKIRVAFNAGKNWQGEATSRFAEMLAVSPILVEVTSMLERELGFPTPRDSKVNYVVAHSVIRQLNGQPVPQIIFQQGHNEYVTFFKVNRVDDSDDYSMSVVLDEWRVV